ncbi:MAG: Gfo/Idh/MocA family oxidoreductase [Gammaproteobacteria bacterium]|nr:Gfo/Idh/MocA family oxidoreductase [Gammaproteobacteria bacterium]
MKKMRIALIGVGYIANFHARGIAELPYAEIAVAVGLPKESAMEFAAKYGIKEFTDNALSLAKRKDIDAVIIGTPNKFHVPYAIEFLENGKDVFLEKPMAMNADEGVKLIKVANETKQLVMVGHMWRFDQETAYIKSIIDSGKLGKIVKTKGYGIHENWGPVGWFTKKDLAGGGALIDMGVHAIDTVRYLLGDPKPTEVYAKISTQFGDYDVDDTGIIMITWDSGATSVIESGWWQPHMDGPEAATRLYGKKGFASLFPTEIKFNDKENWEELKNNWVEKSEHCDQIIYSEQMKYFINCLRNRIKPSPGLVEGQIVMEIVDAAYKSSEKGKAIKL